DSDAESEGDEDEEAEEAAERETAAAKRLRLAKRYIETVKSDLAGEVGETDAADLDREIIASRLHSDALEAAGKMQKKIADAVVVPDENNVIFFSTRESTKKATTAVALPPTFDLSLLADGSMRSRKLHMFSSAKDGIIAQWDISNVGTGKRAPKNAKAHTGEVLCLTVSVDGKYLASGGADHRICLWDTGEEFLPVKVFQQHRDAITSLVFQRRTDNGVLYSASADRTIKLWNTDELGYIETLFGHQESIHDMDALTREQAVSVGGRDRSVRLWKISQEQQLVFKGGAATKGIRKQFENKTHYLEGSIDAVAMIDEDRYITGGDTGVISLWSIHKKKPVFVFHAAHGYENPKVLGWNTRRPRAITAVAALPHSDMFMTGSWDGYVRLWKLAEDNKSFIQFGAVPAKGIVNCISL
ncbi:WD40 repeat-like protein, partial [Ramicandelaber brevisporus]